MSIPAHIVDQYILGNNEADFLADPEISPQIDYSKEEIVGAAEFVAGFFEGKISDPHGEDLRVSLDILQEVIDVVEDHIKLQESIL